MAKKLVNLDALVERQDFAFAASDKARATKVTAIKAGPLKVGEHTFQSLRKPDFQRETAFWTPQKVKDLIEAFVKEELIPSIVLWRSPNNNLFIIDGSHRLSCLIAWVNDDYGDGEISKEFFDPSILDEHSDAARETRELVNESIGAYADIAAVYRVPSEQRIQRYVELCNGLNEFEITVQSFAGGPDVAESSFFKINEQGVRLSKTELSLLRARKAPNAVAARAISLRGSNNFYWKSFAQPKRNAIENKSANIHDLMFNPPLTSSVLQTTDVPIAGKGKMGDSLPLIFEIVNMANRVDAKPDTDKHSNISVDNDGSLTSRHLQRTERIIERINSKDHCSLCLHPLIYFYSEGGRHLPSSFVATFELINDLEAKDQFKQFSAVRSAFEQFLISHRAFIPQLQRKARGELKAIKLIKKYFEFCIDHFKRHGSASQLENSLKNSKEFSFLKETAYHTTQYGATFSSETKNSLFIRRELNNAETCSICGARINAPDIDYDHDLDRKHGGDGNPDNAKPAHIYCNRSKDQLKPFLANWRKSV